jgi:hypothetical protein
VAETPEERTERLNREAEAARVAAARETAAAEQRAQDAHARGQEGRS